MVMSLAPLFWPTLYRYVRMHVMTESFERLLFERLGLRTEAVTDRAFQFGQKSFDSIRFSLPNRFFRFDSIRQCDKFAASTLIFK